MSIRPANHTIEGAVFNEQPTFPRPPPAVSGPPGGLFKPPGQTSD